MNVAQQEQAVDHAGYLMAYDKKEKRAKGVTGIDADGNLTLEEAAGENRHHFMKVDRHGNILSNFGKNFMYQFNNPSGFLFYNMPKDRRSRIACTRRMSRHGAASPAIVSITSTYSTSGRSTGGRPSVMGSLPTSFAMAIIWNACFRGGNRLH